MKREELKHILTSAGIPDMLYNLNGTGKGDEGKVAMMQFGDKWRIYLTESGGKRVDEYFDSEEEACDFFYKQLIL